MTQRTTIGGTSLIAGLVLAGGLVLDFGVAHAAPRASTVKSAAVDTSGRVVLVQPEGPTPEVVGRGAAAPCPGTAAIPAEAAKALVGRVAAEEGFYPDFVLSVARIESRFNVAALSDKGAFGLMQLMPATAQRFQVDLCDPEGNVRGGIRYLRSLHARFRNPFFILAAYNAGEEAVLKHRGVPPYPETVRFVADVMNDFYTWPNPAGTRKASSPPTAAAAPAQAEAPVIIEIAQRSAPAAGPKPSADPSGTEPGPVAPAGPHWDAGFVMHVD